MTSAIAKHVYMRQFAFSIMYDILFVVVLILDRVACLVRMQDEVLLLHNNWDDNYLFCSQTTYPLSIELN